MNRRSYSRTAVCFALSCAMLFATAACCFNAPEVAAADTDTLSQLQQQSREIEDRQSEIDKKLEQARQDIENQQKLKEALDEKISAVEDKIDNLNQTVGEYNSQINSLQAEIDRKEAEIADDYEKLKQRLKIIYMSGDVSSLEIILGAKDFTDFIDKVNLVRFLGAADEELITNLQVSVAEINADKKTLEASRQRVKEEKQELENNRQELERLQRECDELISDLQENQQNLTEENEKYEQEKQELEGKITQWFKDYLSSSKTDIFPSDTAAGTYAWPAPYCTVVTTEYGEDGHKGIDMACDGSAYGLPVVAAQDGTVVNVNRTDEWGSGWGYYLMIDHGGGFATLYAHCSVIVAEAGESVQKGQIIGYIGNTGRSYGAHLHFECWYNGSRYNPRYALGS